MTHEDIDNWVKNPMRLPGIAHCNTWMHVAMGGDLLNVHPPDVEPMAGMHPNHAEFVLWCSDNGMEPDKKDRCACWDSPEDALEKRMEAMGATAGGGPVVGMGIFMGGFGFGM